MMKRHDHVLELEINRFNEMLNILVIYPKNFNFVIFT